jgi:hypothetical protein
MIFFHSVFQPLRRSLVRFIARISLLMRPIRNTLGWGSHAVGRAYGLGLGYLLIDLFEVHRGPPENDAIICHKPFQFFTAALDGGNTVVPRRVPDSKLMLRIEKRARGLGLALDTQSVLRHLRESDTLVEFLGNADSIYYLLDLVADGNEGVHGNTPDSFALVVERSERARLLDEFHQTIGLRVDVHTIQ